MKSIETQRKLRRKVRGQGMTEYIIIVALIAIAAIGVITVFGKDIRLMFGNAADALTGSTSMTYGYTQASTKATGNKDLSSFANDNAGW